jgi:glycine/D-amino acid oxidase-like deaminating enzyme
MGMMNAKVCIMNKQRATTQRVVIIGGGVAGLSSAVRLAQAGLPVTVLEASQLGGAASTRNQGWLHSGGIHALDSPEYARTCYASLGDTLKFCPNCLEPQIESMAYLFSRGETLLKTWTNAWSAVGIPWYELPLENVFAALPGLERSRIQHAFQLPDRAFRPDVLLSELAATAANAGVEIRTGIPVKRLNRQRDQIEGVVTATGEELAARMVILAGGSSGFDLFEEFHPQLAGGQHEVELVPLKAHLLAFQPEVGRLPFCIADAGGFNHIPHPPTSVFGSGRWEQVTRVDDHADELQIESLRKQVHEYFRGFPVDSSSALAWAGTMMQALKIDQIETGHALWPAVIDHARHAPHIQNLVSIFPGRATLWSRLAELTRQIVLSKLDTIPSNTAHPPWHRG